GDQPRQTSYLCSRPSAMYRNVTETDAPSLGPAPRWMHSRRNSSYTLPTRLEDRARDPYSASCTASRIVVLPVPFIPPNNTMGRIDPLCTAGRRSKVCDPRYRQKLWSCSSSRIMTPPVHY